MVMDDGGVPHAHVSQIREGRLNLRYIFSSSLIVIHYLFFKFVFIYRDFDKKNMM